MNQQSSSIRQYYLTIPGSSGRPMATDLFLPASSPRAVVIYIHGINGFKDWGGLPDLLEKLAKAGIAVVNFNFSHNGTVPADPSTFTDLEAYGADSYLRRQYDLAQIEEFLANQGASYGLDGLPLYLIGHSRGGVDALLYAAQHDTVSKLVTWSAPDHAQTPWQNWDADTIKKWREEGVIYRGNGRTQQEMPIYYGLYEEFRQHPTLLDVEGQARRLDIPWLVVHGEEDEAVFVKAAYRYKEWNPQAQVKIIPGAGHTYGRKHPWQQDFLPEASQAVLARTREFLLT